MHFADIACGSGSFLLGIFDLLLRYHTNYYNANKTNRARGRRAGCIEWEDGTLHLSLLQRRNILLRNIYGVDVDPQAVEVAQLSLYLKLLEDETTATSQHYQMEFREALLPSLNSNIISGNSLIGWEMLEGQLFDPDEERKLNPMSFETAFPQIMKDGGFDAIVGNPPYVRPHRIPAAVKEILWRGYRTFVAKSDLYSCFMERGLTLIKNGGLLSFIVPQTWTSLESFTDIRKFILRNASVQRLVQLPKKVFGDATVETCIFIFRRTDEAAGKRGEILVEKIDGDGEVTFEREFNQQEIEDAYLHNFQLYGKDESKNVIEKIQSAGRPLAYFVNFLYGFKTADDEKFIESEPRHKESQPFIRSAAIHRYHYDPPTEYVWYVPELMVRNRKTARPGEAARFEAEKIIVARMGKELVATYDEGGLYVKDAMLLLGKGDRHSLLYLLGLTNSRLLNFYYQEFFITIDVLKNALLSLPIRAINFSDPEQAAQHDKIVQFVKQMLTAKSQLELAYTDRDRNLYQRKCNELDRQINTLVYELYGLTEDEIAVVESE